MGSSLAAIVSRFWPVVMVCRNPRRAAQIFEHGIRVDGGLTGEASPVIVRSIGELSAVGGVTYLFVATKTTSIPSVCESLRPVLGTIGEGDTPVRIISYQNGIDPGRQLMELLGTSRVMRMVLNYGAVLDGEGCVHVPLYAAPHYIGCVNPELVPDGHRLARALSDAGVETTFDENIEHHVWQKAVLNAAYNPVCALVNSTVGGVLNSPSHAVALRLLREGVAVAKAEGFDLGEGFCERAETLIAKSSDHVPSMVEDIRRGRPSEIGQLNRQLIERARRLDVPVPTHETIDSLIETFDWQVYNGRAL